MATLILNPTKLMVQPVIDNLKTGKTDSVNIQPEGRITLDEFHMLNEEYMRQNPPIIVHEV